MARNVSLTTLISDVRQLGGWVGLHATTSRITDAMITRALNQNATRLWLEVVRTGGQHKVTTTVSANTTSGISSYALASGFLWGLAVLVTSDGVERELTNIDMLHASDFTDSSGGAGIPAYFQFVGDNLELTPTPDGVYPYRYRYVGIPTDLANPGDQFDGILGFEQYIVARAVEDLATNQKEWDLVNAMKVKAQEHKQEVFDCLIRRNPLPNRVINTRALERRNRNGRRWW